MESNVNIPFARIVITGSKKLTVQDFVLIQTRYINPLSTSTRYATEYKQTVDWSSLLSLADDQLTTLDAAANTLLESEIFGSAVTYDAYSRPISMTQPDSSVVLPGYNEAGLLETVDIKIRGAASAANFVADINYDEKGQRQKIDYANGAKTKYTYDPDSYRITRILTTRNAGADILQDLNYTYDAVGNITEQVDNAQQTHFFQNAVVSPDGKYTYDALYRLLSASGREHANIGQAQDGDIPINEGVPQNNNSTAVERYTQAYEHDAIGNILKMIHTASTNSWTRGYHYDTTTDNRLLKSSLPGNDANDHTTYTAAYTHDVHGNMTAMPHLSSIEWDFADMMKSAVKGSSTAYYVYEGGQRVRKVIEDSGSKKDRLYLGSVEIYRQYSGSTKTLERESLHVSDDTGRIAMVETKTYENGSITPVPVIRYQFSNHLGSASLELDTSANLISYEEYHPYGTSAYRLGTSASETSLKRYRFHGKEKDEETGFHYHGMRYCCPWLARWTSVDPVFHPHQSSYNAMDANPIMIVDPSGGDGEEAKPAKQDPIIYTSSNGQRYLYIGDGHWSQLTGDVEVSPTWMDTLSDIHSYASESVSSLFKFRLKSLVDMNDNSAAGYGKGLAAGLGDGVLDTLGLVYSVAEAQRFLSPTSPEFFTDAAADYRQGLLDTASAFAEILGDAEKRNMLVNTIMDGIAEYFGDVTFQGTGAEAGYAHGKLVFEILIAVLTAGEGNLATGAKKILNSAKEGAESLAKLVKQGMKNYAENNRDKLNMGFDLSDLFKKGKSIPKNQRSHTYGNKRHNLQWLTKHLGEGQEAHHLFPDKFADKFPFNIHNPRHLSWWEKSPHRRNSKAWNEAWENEFFAIHRNPQDLEFSVFKEFAQELAGRYGLNTNFLRFRID